MTATAVAAVAAVEEDKRRGRERVGRRALVPWELVARDGCLGVASRTCVKADSPALEEDATCPRFSFFASSSFFSFLLL